MVRPQRKLTAVMFTDIVGYSAMVNRNEQQARELLEMHRRLLRGQVAAWGGRHVDNIGDGTLSIFDSALHAVECAISIQQELARHNEAAPEDRRVRLRIGLHQGDVEHGRGGVFGDGVNVCARLEPLSPPGGIALSSMVQAQIHGPLRAHFRSAGVQSLKNIPEAVEIYKLPEADVAAAAAELQPAPRQPWSARARLLAAGGLVAALLLIAAATFIWIRLQGTPADDPSLAVLPLENMATEPGSAELVAGLHDALITEIARTPHLKVISRSSVMRYGQQRASVPEVARLLKVANVLEGSVQRSGSRIRVNVQLIRAATDEHIWAEIYDRDLKDLFDVQSEIAREIARKIQGNLALPAMPESERPTHNAKAYELYLRAISREEEDPKLGFAPTDDALRLLEQAVALDPGFALAHAAIARYAAWGARWANYSDSTRVDGYVVRLTQAAERAITLKPQLPEALLGMGLARYWKERDPAVAEPYFTRALEQRPAYPAALYILSGLYANKGNLDRAADVVRALLDVDPGNEKAWEQLYTLLQRMRQYDDTERIRARWLQMSQNQLYVEYLGTQLHFFRSGDLGPWKQLMARPDEKTGAIDPAYERWAIAMYESRFDHAAAVAIPRAAGFMQKRSNEYEWASYAGQALFHAAKAQQAKPYLEAVAAYFRDAVARNALDPHALDQLGQMQGALGDIDGALANLNRALELAAPKADARPSLAYYDYLSHRAPLLAAAGRRQEALADVDRLLREPSGQHAPVMLLDPYWGELRKDPEFQARVKRQLPRA